MYKVYNLDSEKESHGAYIFNKTAVGQFEFMQGVRREWTYFDTTKNSHYYHRTHQNSDLHYIHIYLQNMFLTKYTIRHQNFYFSNKMPPHK